MGAFFEFKCPSCKNELMTSGGKDVGFQGPVETHYCVDCKDVFNLVLEQPDRICFKCNSDNITPWAPNYPCPECGSKMKRGGMCARWD